jgi:predicted metal-dependent hydrolase
MPSQLQLGDLTVDVVFKDIKNVHLSVYPPNGRVRISAPRRISETTLRAFAASKMPWIREQQRKLREQERESQREYLDRETHYVFGRRYLLKILEEERPASIERKHRTLFLNVRPGADESAMKAVLDDWYRQLLKEAAAPIIAKWEPRLGVTVRRVFVQHMKTKWGSCNHRAGSIRLNTELAKKPPQCLEYLVVHEMVHLIEPTHNARFRAVMDKHMPRWQFYRDLLNSLPLRQEHWEY